MSNVGLTSTRLWPWLRLMRFDRPIGTLLLLWPTLWALWFAGSGRPSIKNLAIFVCGVVVMRAAGCVINDYADRDLDGQVQRTRLRPLAAAEIAPANALRLFIGLMMLAFLLVLQTNRMTIVLSVIGALLAACYPFAKRVTHLPQVVLGTAWAWSVPMVFAAEHSALPAGLWVIFIAVILWTVAFDTYYAMVDRPDDLQIGVKSTAILFAESDLLIISVLKIASLGCLAGAGYLFDRGWVYYAGLLAAAILFARQWFRARERDSESCFAAFLNNNRVGAVIFVGLALDYLLKPATG